MLNHRMAEPSVLFIGGTHIKASANKKKHRKQLAARAAKAYESQLRAEVHAEWAALGTPPAEDEDDDDEPPMQEKTVPAAGPDSGMFVKGEHERQFAYEAHTVCDKRGFVLDAEVTAGNVHQSAARDAVYNRVTEQFNVEFALMDAEYKTPWIAKKVLDGGKVHVPPYTRYHGKKDGFRPWDCTHDEANGRYLCPMGRILRHVTAGREGKRTYRSTPVCCKGCPCREKCGANEKGQKLLARHIWQKHLDLAEQLRKTERGRALYERRKETVHSPCTGFLTG